MRYDGHFRLAHELKKHLHEVMGWDGPITHRQFICWNEWLDFVSINHPSRDNYYQMQVACEQRRSYVKQPNNVKMDSFKLTFTKKVVTQNDPNNPQPGPLTRQQRIEQIKQTWISRMTAPITVKDGGQIIDTIEPLEVKAKRIREEALVRMREQRKQQASNKPVATPKPKPQRSVKRPTKQSLKPAPDNNDEI